MLVLASAGFNMDMAVTHNNPVKTYTTASI
jgi:hypothetical protein